MANCAMKGKAGNLVTALQEMKMRCNVSGRSNGGMRSLARHPSFGINEPGRHERFA
jgi:hypothetical protein